MAETRTETEESESSSLVELLRKFLVSGVMAIDGGRRICAFSAEAERLTGQRAEATLGQPLDVLPDALRSFIQDCWGASGGFSEREIVVPNGDAPSWSIHVRCFPCVGQGSAPHGMVVLLNELSSAQKLSVNMQRLDRLASIGTLSASMAHEIKNALVPVNTFIEDLIQRNKDSELSGLVSRELKRIDQIVSQMLKFAGPAHPTFSRVSLHRILEHCLRLIRPQLESRKIRLSRSLAARPDTLEGDDYQLEQIFLNLFLNAITAMGPGGQLSVSTEIVDLPPASADNAQRSPERWLQITISDTGSGIPPENLGRLFEPFFTTKAHGTGLGLAITRRIILEHRGKITVQSELNKGTTFRIVFPALERRA